MPNGPADGGPGRGGARPSCEVAGLIRRWRENYVTPGQFALADPAI
jgi:hypothetical protein